MEAVIANLRSFFNFFLLIIYFLFTEENYKKSLLMSLVSSEFKLTPPEHNLPLHQPD